MKIVVSGGSGFVGSAVVARLLEAPHEVMVLTRSPRKVSAGRALEWDGRTQGGWSSEVAGADVVINLAGENIGEGRWTAERKRRLIDSRLDATRALVEAMGSAPERQRTFISASAVGFYGIRGDEVLDETAAAGEGFLAELARRWEEEARRAEAHARTVILRLGVVIGPGGALEKMLLPFRLGVGGRIGHGRQWMSWVAREDVVRLFEWVIAGSDARGVFNATSPNPVRNAEFTRALGAVLRRPTIFPVPAFALRAAFGQMGVETVLNGQRVIPARAQSNGFRFALPRIDEALAAALSRR